MGLRSDSGWGERESPAGGGGRKGGDRGGEGRLTSSVSAEDVTLPRKLLRVLLSSAGLLGLSLEFPLARRRRPAGSDPVPIAPSAGDCWVAEAELALTLRSRRPVKKDRLVNWGTALYGPGVGGEAGLSIMLGDSEVADMAIPASEEGMAIGGVSEAAEESNGSEVA